MAENNLKIGGLTSDETDTISSYFEAGIYFKNEEIKKMYDEAGFMTEGSAGFDLIVPEDTVVAEESSGKCKHKNDITLINFGIIVKPPEGYHFELYPRSSTYKKTGLMLINSVGIIDSDYCGADDWLIGCFNHRNFQSQPGLEYNANMAEYYIPKGTRIGQLLLRKTNKFKFKGFLPEDKSRGGFGSTGV